MSHILDATSPLSAERQLLLAVLHRSLHDLKPNAPAQDRHASVAFFSNADGHLQTVCDLLDLDYTYCISRRNFFGVKQFRVF